MSHDSKKQQIIQAVKDLFSDDSVPHSKTRESLEEIVEECDACLDCLDE